MTSKVIQIILYGIDLAALCEDGTIWRRDWVAPRPNGAPGYWHWVQIATAGQTP